MSDQELHDAPETLPELPDDSNSAGGWAVPESVHFNEPDAVHTPHIQAEPDTLAYTDSAHLPDDVEIITEEDEPHSPDLSAEDEASTEESISSEVDSPSLPVERGWGGEVNSRLDALTRKIEAYPNAPVNYVLRGEVYSEGGDDDLAAADFRRAIELADARDQALDWGYINASYVDRARAGLRQLNRD